MSDLCHKEGTHLGEFVNFIRQSMVMKIHFPTDHGELRAYKSLSASKMHPKFSSGSYVKTGIF